MLEIGILVSVVVCWLLPSFLVGWAAGERGRDTIPWFFVSLFCSPIAALLALMASPVLEDEADDEDGKG